LPYAFGSTIYSQPSSGVSAEFWSSAAGFSFFHDDSGTGTGEFVLPSAFPLGVTFGASADFRFFAANLLAGGASFGAGMSLRRADTGAPVCAGPSSPSTVVPGSMVLYVVSCSVSHGTLPAGVDLLLDLSGISANDASFTQGLGGGNSWRTFTPYVEISDDGVFDSAAPSATSSVSGVLSPTIGAIGVATTTAGALCTGVNASSTGILDTITNGFGTAMCYAGVILFVPSADSLNNFYNLASTTESKFPFSYLRQIQTILYGATASTTDNFLSLSTSVGTSTSSFYIPNAVLISTSSMANFFPDSVRNDFKAILTAGFYLMATLFVYRKVMGIWQQV